MRARIFVLNVKIYGNRFYKICDNADEIINVFVHEKDHIEKARTWGYDTYLEKRQVIPEQLKRARYPPRENIRHGMEQV